MKLQRTTLILLLLAVGLGGLVYFYETHAAPQREAAKTKEQQIFNFEEEQIQSITIKNPQETLQFERVAQKAEDIPKSSSWQMKAPVEAPARDPSVSFLVNLLVKGKSDRSLTVPANELQTYGLDKPLPTIEVTLKNQKNHQLVLGKLDFTESFLYAQADTSAKASDKIQLLLVPKDLQYAVKRPLSEWQAKEKIKKDNSK